ncbi:MAG TPA: PilZ domain-containing protein [Phycisphaerae bacterium]|nr:PilZ domain-containing protein [Phycisphaerae bacterium]HOJ74617.1 PilZ domain-containing protein [Phycisphaerae bacterium]HOM50516.1 PilZ domain-containing protein [Phycisphaerae bacterium]HON65985.1 PilZ domain-containing protein [Phycisphaerae bacterium]HOQ87988.1 PilZ domain-containing protein [Phycisphaerae bacterium]
MGIDKDRETLDRLLDELDIKGRQQHVGEHADDYWVCQRRHPRYAFRTNCVVRFLSADCTQVLSVEGRTRNLSRGGLGILVRHVFNVGDPVEVEIQVPGQPRMYMAGLVQFIRYAGRAYHELGIALRSAGQQPIFSHNPEAAWQSLDWLRHPTQTARG